MEGDGELAESNKLKRISADQVDALLDRAKAERWTELVLLGPGPLPGDDVEHWPGEQKRTKNVYQLSEHVTGLAEKVLALTDLTALNLAGNGIGNDGTKAIAALANLNSLNLARNNLNHDGAKALAEHCESLSKLRSLNLSGNNIGDKGAKALEEHSESLTKLRSLDLKANKVGVRGANAIASLTNLTLLNLARNNIGLDGVRAIANKLTNLTSLTLVNLSLIDSDGGIGGLRNLESLALVACDLSGRGVQNLGNLRKLTSLNLNENYIGSDGARTIASLENLTYLNLWGNGIGDEGAEALVDRRESLTKLTSLMLGNNRIGSVGATKIATFENLTELDLAKNPVGDDGAQALRNLGNLCSLSLGDENIGDNGARAISVLENLHSLVLSGDNIGDSGAQAIGNLKQLRSLRLAVNTIADSGVRALGALNDLTMFSLSVKNISKDSAKAIASLNNLTSLDLRGIGNDEAHAYLDALDRAPDVGRLKELNLAGNQNLKYPLTSDVLKNRGPQEILGAYRVWRRVNPATTPHVVILIHGIRTKAHWQNNIRRTLESHGFIVNPTNYGTLDVLRFLFPFPVFRRKIIDEVTRQIRAIIKDNKTAKCSIIAHSFGTYVVSEILRRHADIDFHRIIFCGSVLSDAFKFERHVRQFQQPLVNEVGSRDSWPAIAEAVTWGYGSAGTYGFRRPGVHDRWHNGKTHSAFLNHDFCLKYWTPFLDSGHIVRDDVEPEQPPWWIRLVTRLQIKYAIIFIALAMVIGLNIF